MPVVPPREKCEGVEHRKAPPLCPCRDMPATGAPSFERRVAFRRSTRGISVPGAVLPGVGQGISPFCRPAFAKPSSTPASSHSRQPVIVPADGDPRPPGAGVTRPGSRRRTHPASAVSCRTPLAWGRQKDYMTRNLEKSRGVSYFAQNTRFSVKSTCRKSGFFRGGTNEGSFRSSVSDLDPNISSCATSI